MKISLAWLRDHLEGDTPAEELARRLTAVGMNVELREAAGADEAWDVDITSNRPDAMNHRGLAREAVAAGCGTLRPLEVRLREGATAASELARLEVTDGEGCPRYCARVIRGVRVGPSPAWLVDRLASCGVRPINNVVDATNYVLLDVGHPLHAFDLRFLAGPTVRVRKAAAGERMTTLDGVERELVPSDVVIADAEKAVALAGIMGGADSEIREDTADVLLESAYFDPLSVRRTARRLGLATEASHRFERGADRAMARHAVDLAAELIVRLAGGEVAAGVLDSAPTLPPARQIVLDRRRLGAFAGCEIAASFVQAVLTALGCDPRPGGEEMTCSVPSWRVDLELPEDLYEEVLRHWGYDRVPSALPETAAAPGTRLGTWPVTDRARDALVHTGLAEAVTYSFITSELDAATLGSPLADRGAPVVLDNPLSARMAVMRRSILGGLAEAAAGNLRRGAEGVLLGEVGRVFFGSGGRPREEERLAVVMAGRQGGWDRPVETDFLDLKGTLEAILEPLGLEDLRWSSLEIAVLAPGQAAGIHAGDELVGVAGRLGDALGSLVDSPLPLWLAEVDLGRVAPRGVPTVRPLPRFPAVVADLTVRHARTVTYAELVVGVRAAGPEWLEAVQPVVQFEGAGVAAGEVKTTLRLVYRLAERSLTQDEVNAAHFALMDELGRRLPVSFQ
ncbi:MAG: phenylalanine--tRNA ligase subunit beta [Thermoanaerobaculaceae bacterium]